MDALLAFDTELLSADLQLLTGDIAKEDGLETAVVISLFTDRVAQADDVLPDHGNDRRGWWGDDLTSIEGDLTGSRLWLLGREKQQSEVLRRGEEYASEALKWLIDDGVVRRIDVAASVLKRGVWVLRITLHKPDGSAANYAYEFLWNGMK